MNLLLSTDVYKVCHADQYPAGTNKIYSYLCARKGFGEAPVNRMTFFGLQYYLEKYLMQSITENDVNEFIDIYSSILNLSEDTIKRLRALSRLGYLPLEIKAVPEFEEYPLQIPLMTITNTHSDFAWVVNFIEGLMLKIWYPCSVATRSKQYYDLAKRYSNLTCDDDAHLSYSVHDFGYRSCSSEETAGIGGAAHLVNFAGSDTILGEYTLKKYYGVKRAKSVPASEHSVMCSFGRENEIEAFRNMLKVYSTGIVSIVSDTYDLWNVLTNIAEELKKEILARDGKVVFRPDSGDPQKIICGDPVSSHPQIMRGALQLLWEKFGGTINKKGFKVLNPKVGLIYGDGITLERYKSILANMEAQGFASSNLVIGVGGILLQNHSRDDLGFAQKTTYIEVDGNGRNTFKDPITDKKKKSHKGLLSLDCNFNVKEECTWAEESKGILNTVFLNGEVSK